MKKFVFLAVILLLAFVSLVACGGNSPAASVTTPNTPAPQSNVVHMSGVIFDISSITIKKGSTLIFITEQGGAPHNLVNGTGGQAHPETGVPDFGSGGHTVGSGVSWTSPPWNTAGTFHVTCTYHPTTMTMTVIVTA